MTTLVRQYQRMAVKLQELAIKSEFKVPVRYKNVKTVAMRGKNRCFMKFKILYKARVTKDCVVFECPNVFRPFSFVSLALIIVNKGEWLLSLANSKGANKDAKI